MSGKMVLVPHGQMMPVPEVPEGYDGVIVKSYPTAEELAAFLAQTAEDLRAGRAVLDGNEVTVLYRKGAEEMWADGTHTRKVTVNDVHLDTGERVIRLQVSYNRPGAKQI